jgi:hypothetical protein
MLLHALVHLIYKVVRRQAINDQTILQESELLRGLYLQVIVQAIDGIEDGLQIMVTIFAFAHYT